MRYLVLLMLACGGGSEPAPCKPPDDGPCNNLQIERSCQYTCVCLAVPDGKPTTWNHNGHCRIE